MRNSTEEKKLQLLSRAVLFENYAGPEKLFLLNIQNK